MNTAAGFRLLPGQPAPVQQSRVSCGAACLVVARMLRDPALAAWVSGDGPPRTPGTAVERFTQLEQKVMRLTNSVRPVPGGFHMPWPRALGTPPWGARRVMEDWAAQPGSRYEVVWLRQRRARSRDLTLQGVAAGVLPGLSALLYVGNSTLPRHVTLVFVDRGRTMVYEPARGEVRDLDEFDFGARRLSLAGWDHPWVLVRPLGHARVAVRSARLARRDIIAGPALTRGTASGC